MNSTALELFNQPRLPPGGHLLLAREREPLGGTPLGVPLWLSLRSAPVLYSLYQVLVLFHLPFSF
jgi:hypothetical protein